MGDTHCGSMGDGQKILQNPANKDDLVIVLGDFGFIWTSRDDHEIGWFHKFFKLPFTLCFIDGNHENFERLKTFPEIDFREGKAGNIHDCVYHLKRGQIYNIEGKKILTIGGASSIDKNDRIPGISWWKDEEITYEEQNVTLENLDKHNWEVDYVLTHTLPTQIIRDNINFPAKEDSNTKFFDHLIKEGLKFKKWYCGHFHIDRVIDDRFYILYKNIIQIR